MNMNNGYVFYIRHPFYACFVLMISYVAVIPEATASKDTNNVGHSTDGHTYEV